MQTLFGPVKFCAYEVFKRQNSVNTPVLQIIDGKFEAVWSPEVVSIQFTLPMMD
jgi:branched-chain amino acid transport system substrate-binding protein